MNLPFSILSTAVARCSVLVHLADRCCLSRKSRKLYSTSWRGRVLLTSPGVGLSGHVRNVLHGYHSIRIYKTLAKYTRCLDAQQGRRQVLKAHVPDPRPKSSPCQVVEISHVPRATTTPYGFEGSSDLQHRVQGRSLCIKTCLTEA